MMIDELASILNIDDCIKTNSIFGIPCIIKSNKMDAFIRGAREDHIFTPTKTTYISYHLGTFRYTFILEYLKLYASSVNYRNSINVNVKDIFGRSNTYLQYCSNIFIGQDLDALVKEFQNLEMLG
jgi:hypothetical protein